MKLLYKDLGWKKWKGSIRGFRLLWIRIFGFLGVHLIIPIGVMWLVMLSGMLWTDCIAINKCHAHYKIIIVSMAENFYSNISLT